MAIRKGVDAIEDRNQQVQDQMGGSDIPEVFLRDDGEVAVFRILTDDPLDCDMHNMYDSAVGGRPEWKLCQRPDPCEHCDKEIPRSRMFYFWVWLQRILHPTPAEDGSWEPMKIGNRTYYVEEVNYPHIFKRTFGRGNANWNAFKSIYDNFGTWKDRPFTWRRNGQRKNINTTYALTGLDKEPLSKEIAEMAGKLPSLESIVTGKVTSLDGVEGLPESPYRRRQQEQGSESQGSGRAPGGRRSSVRSAVQAPAKPEAEEDEPPWNDEEQPSVTEEIPEDVDLENI